MAVTINFTKKTLSALKTPAPGARVVYLDAKTTGLQLRVSGTGVKTFSMYRRIKGGPPQRVTLGCFPEMTVEQARNMAARVNAEIAEGANPAEARRAHRDEMTFAELFDEYGERHGKKKRSWSTDQSNYRNHLRPLAKRKLSAISRDVISRILSDMDRDGKAGATVNNVRALISSVFGRAIEWGYASENPVAGVKTRATVSRDRFLQSYEMPRFFEAVAGEPNETLRDYILLALLTGARRSNLLEIEWKHVNLEEGIWRIPRTKNNDPQNVTLSPDAVALLRARRDSAEAEAKFVFPGNGKSGHIVEPKKGVMRVMARAGIPYGRDVEDGVTLHDLRRTLGSWQMKTGATLSIVGKSLNHKSHQATLVYGRLDLDPVRQSVNTATAAMLGAGRVSSAEEILSLDEGEARLKLPFSFNASQDDIEAYLDSLDRDGVVGKASVMLFGLLRRLEWLERAASLRQPAANS